MNALLPALLPAFSTILTLAVVLLFVHLWVKDTQVRQTVVRGAIVIATLVVLGIVIFAVNSAVVQPGQTVDRSVIEAQERALERRLQEGGH